MAIGTLRQATNLLIKNGHWPNGWEKADDKHRTKCVKCGATFTTDLEMNALRVLANASPCDGQMPTEGPDAAN